jgi:hypothetical protein
MKRHLHVKGIQDEEAIESTATGLGEGRVNASTIDGVKS